MKSQHLKELLYQALETKQGGIQIYETAIRCAVNEELKEEWEEHLAQTETHETVLRALLKTLGFDPDRETPGRAIVRHLGASLVKAMEMALESTDPTAAELVATECVLLAETKDHLNWELIGYGAEYAKRELKKAFAEAYAEVEQEVDEHLYHASGWSRELWLCALGLPSLLPPPEGTTDVESVVRAARARAAREAMR
jgi:rubrerythrin